MRRQHVDQEKLPGVNVMKVKHVAGDETLPVFVCETEYDTD